MKFANIEMLFLIWSVPALFFICLYGIKKRQKILKDFALEKSLKSIACQSGAWQSGVNIRWIKAFLILCVVLLLCFALAGPQYGYKWEKIEQKGIDIIIALDCSKSMLATDIKPSRLDRAKREIVDLLGMLEGDRAGLVAFAGTSFLQCPLTLDYNAFYLFLNTLSPDFIPVGGTDLAGAIQVGLNSFNEKDNTEKAIILITDGENTGGDAIDAAKKASAAGVKIFCIGVGKDEGIPLPDKNGTFKKDKDGNIVLTKIDEELLKRIVEQTKGAYVRSVAGDMDLDMIYKNEIRGKMETATLKSGKRKVWEHRFQWFLAIAIFLLVLEMFIPCLKKAYFIIFLCLMLFNNVQDVVASSVNQSMQKGFKEYESQNYEKALKCFIDAQLEDPENSKIFYNIANAYYKIDDFKSAKANYEKAAQSKDKSLKQKAFYNLGNTDYRMGNLEQALKQYEQALKIDPQDRLAKENIDFVKKQIEKQKQKQKQNQESKQDNQNKESNKDKNQENKQQQDKDKEEKQDKSKTSSNQDQNDQDNNDNDEQNNDSQRNQDKSNQPEYGKEMKDNKEQQAGEKQDENSDNSEKREAQASKPLDEQDNNKKNNQKSKMLNRLQDMPGKAMIPSYQKRYVEKDW